jgi:hypothetical protein
MGQQAGPTIEQRSPVRNDEPDSVDSSAEENAFG